MAGFIFILDCYVLIGVVVCIFISGGNKYLLGWVEPITY